MKKKVISVLITLVVGTSLILAACAAPTPTPAPAPAPAPTPARVPTGSITLTCDTFSADTLDPILAMSTSAIFYMTPVYDWVVGTNLEQTEMGEGGIAKSWETSADKLTWTFYLHEGIQFQDGWGEVTAEDVKFSLDRAMGPEALADRGIELAGVVEEVEVADKYTVKIHLKRPDPWIAYKLTPLEGFTGIVVPKKYVEQVGTKGFGLDPIGSGPYKLVKHILGTYMQFEAVPEHWFVGVPKFKNITLRVVPEPATRIAMLYTGDSDMVGVTVAESEEVKAKGFDLGVKPGAMVVSAPGFQRLGEPAAQGLPQQDVRVRKALNLAINRQEILDTIYMGRGTIRPSNYSLTSWNIAYDEDKFPPVYPYDPEQAKKLLAEAGYPDGFKQTMYDTPRPGAPEQPLVNQAIAGYWKKIGLEIDFISMEWGAYRKLEGEGKALYGSFLLCAIGNRSLSTGIFTDYSTEREGCNSLNAELTEITEAAAAAETAEEWIERVQTWEIYILENHVTTPILDADEIYALSPKLKGWQGNAIRNDLNIRGIGMLP